VVEGVVREGELVEVSLDELAARREAGLGAEAVATVDLRRRWGGVGTGEGGGVRG